MHTITTSATHVHTGCPGYIRASLLTASAGGASGYEEAGYRLGLHLVRESPATIDDDDWADVLASADAILHDAPALSAWIAGTYPRIWSRVPPRRRAQFVSGVRRGRLDDLNA